MSEIRFVDTTVRDGSQSLWAMGMRTDMNLPIARRLDDAGFDAVEIMATSFEKKMIRDLQEDPWERLVQVQQRMTNTPLRMIRGRALAAFQAQALRALIEALGASRSVLRGRRISNGS